METLNTRLEEFEIPEAQTSVKQQFKILIILSIIQNLAVIVFVFSPMISLLKTTTDLFINSVFILQVILLRGIPLFALFKLITKKKVGWSLTIIFALIEILLRLPLNAISFDYSDLFTPAMAFFMASIAICIISLIITLLLLKENIRLLFSVSKKRLYISIGIGLLYFAITRLLIAPYLSTW